MKSTDCGGPPRLMESWVVGLLNLAVVAVVAVPIAVLQFCVEPTRRGFFCDDEQISHPVRENTVSGTVLCVFGLGLPVLTISLSEWVIPQPTTANSNRKRLKKIYFAIIDYLFAAAVTVLLTNIAKFSIGRLR